LKPKTNDKNVWKITRAKKSHRCDAHRGSGGDTLEIEEGDYYLHRSTCDKGRWYTDRVCMECAVKGTSLPSTRQKLEELHAKNLENKEKKERVP